MLDDALGQGYTETTGSAGPLGCQNPPSRTMALGWDNTHCHALPAVCQNPRRVSRSEAHSWFQALFSWKPSF